MSDIPPLIRMEENGQAPVLNYEIPDATSYDGRNYIELVLDREDFVPEISVDRSGQIPTPPVVPINPADTHTGIEMNARLVDLQNAFPGRTPSGLLKNLDVQSLSTFVDRGFSAKPVLTPLGTISYLLIKDEPSTGDGTYGDAGGGRPVSTGNDGPSLPLRITIDTPTSGSKVSGPAGGVQVMIRGSIVLPNPEPNVESVEVTINGSPIGPVSQDIPGNWSDWSVSTTISVSGFQTVVARVGTRLGTKTDSAEANRRFQVVLSSVPTNPGQDTTPPTLRVISPVSGTVISDEMAARGNGAVVVHLEGEASDSGGMDTILVTEGGNLAMAMDGQPQSPGDWSRWTADVSLTGGGRHQLQVTARDKAGNVTVVPLTIVVASYPPRRWLYSRLMIVEKVRLSNFLGRYGAGRVLKTFSLLPGEKMEISLKSYNRSSETSKKSSSIFDHVEDEATSEFMDSLGAEQSDKQMHSDSLDWGVAAQVEQGWGSGSAKLSAHVAGAMNAAREQFGKSVKNTCEKHAGKKSALRDIKVNAESESHVETGEEQSLKRSIENINTGRTLNFVFRQMNQEFISLLSLVDVRVAYAAFFQPLAGGPRTVTYREVAVAELDSLVDSVIQEDRRAEVKTAIVNVLENIADQRGRLVSLIETAVPQRDSPQGLMPVPELSYRRVKPDLTSEWKDGERGPNYTTAGILLSATKVVMRTEGVIVDAVLGGGEALDSYSRGLQQATVNQKQAEVAQKTADVAYRLLEKKVVEDGDRLRAAILDKLKPNPAASLTVSMAPGQG